MPLAGGGPPRREAVRWFLVSEQTIVKTYETDKSLNAISGTAAESERIAKAVASVKPDLVIASQCD